MPRTPCSEIVMVPSHDAKRPTMLAPIDKVKKKSMNPSEQNEIQITFIYRVKLAKLAMNALSLVREIDPTLSRVE